VCSEWIDARRDAPRRSLTRTVLGHMRACNNVTSKVVIEALRDLDVVVSIDDFGAGFTSLAYLSSLAVGELKLDRSFISGLSGDGKERDLELVRATIQLGHDMRLRVVAEGIKGAHDRALFDSSKSECETGQR